MEDRMRFAPSSREGWVATALGLGVILVSVATYFLSNAITDGGNEAGPVWLRILVPAAVLAVAIPAVILGLRSRRTDRSILRSIALGIAIVIGGWAALTGVLGFFF